jgi:predicted transcriptional regulator
MTRIPITSEVLAFISNNQPECSSSLLLQFIQETYNISFTRSQFSFLINKLVKKGMITKNGTKQHYFIKKDSI